MQELLARPTVRLFDEPFVYSKIGWRSKSAWRTSWSVS